jgi:methylenetetrahydrofolate dehydrogenase (NADP+)/methenyltetrahydrofolate cyclohydrolase
VGDDTASERYVMKKETAAKAIGLEFALHRLPKNISKLDLIHAIKELQSDTRLSGMIVQLPLPEPLYTSDVLSAVEPALDVDCLTDTNMGKLMMKTATLVPPTAGAVTAILDHMRVDTRGKKVTIIGTGALVGKPLAIMMMNAGATVTTCNSKTRDLPSECLSADIIVTGVGKKNLLTGNMLKENTIVIDTGIDFYKGKMYGDVDMSSVKKVTGYVTPTPGGVGPITVANLLLNTVICAERKNSKKYV